MSSIKDWFLKNIWPDSHKCNHSNDWKIFEKTGGRVLTPHTIPDFVIPPLKKSTVKPHPFKKTVTNKEELQKTISITDSPGIPRRRERCYTDGDATKYKYDRQIDLTAMASSNSDPFSQAALSLGYLRTTSSFGFTTLRDIPTALRRESLLLEQAESIRKHFPKVTVANAKNDSAKEITGDRLRVSLKFEPKSNKVVVFVREADLSKSIKGGSVSDTYVTVAAIGENKSSEAMYTKTQKMEPHPVYDEKFTFFVPVRVFHVSYFSIILRIFSHRRLRSNKMIGQIVLGYQGIQNSEVEHWHDAIEHPGQEITSWHAIVNNDVYL